MRNSLLATCVFGGLLMLSACDKAEKASQTAVASSTTNVSPAIKPQQVAASVAVASSNNAAAKGVVEQLMGVMSSAFLMANQMSEKGTGKPKFTQQHITCFTSTDNQLIEAKIQEYLQTKFNADELRQLNDFYASEVGKKQIVMTKQMIAGMMGDKSADVSASMPSAEEMKAIQDFAQSPVGAKLQRVLQDKQALEPFIAPAILQKQQTCHMPK